MGVRDQPERKGNMTCGGRAREGEEAGADVPMVTQVKDVHCGDGRVPRELDSKEGTPIWTARREEFGFSDGF